VLVAATAGASLGDDDTGVGARQVGHELVAHEDLRADRNGEHRILAACTVRELAAPAPPRPARSFWFGRKPERSRRRGSAASTTSPPSPPSPPSGPPRGTYFSRRKWIEPSPPRPATAVSLAWS
jgi:hypothetical protein